MLAVRFFFCFIGETSLFHEKSQNKFNQESCYGSLFFPFSNPDSWSSLFYPSIADEEIGIYIPFYCPLAYHIVFDLFAVSHWGWPNSQLTNELGLIPNKLCLLHFIRFALSKIQYLEFIIVRRSYACHLSTTTLLLYWHRASYALQVSHRQSCGQLMVLSLKTFFSF